ncbi:osmotically inducible protein C [Geothrix oryzae]|uniref:Osmotically inducible protein C n=1 Tax=Geothrix oryzae TaxID=2927975 RepID=A0ABN6UZM8_9BACT|nr:OsmC family protein [Geothrix oryzae]BDU69838.1 osmotically inducible protein C [Geothrix oryzae]
MGSIATIHNGVNVEDLNATVAQVKANPALAKFTFRSKAKWINRAHSQSTFDSLYGAGQEHKRATPMFLEGDEPAALLGTDLAPNAGEAALHALSSCLSVTYAYTAAAMGLDITSLSFDMETDTDLRGFLELDKAIRSGLSQIRVKVNLACSGTPQQIKELHEQVMRTSPLYDTFKNPVDIRMSH